MTEKRTPNSTPRRRGGNLYLAYSADSTASRPSTYYERFRSLASSSLFDPTRIDTANQLIAALKTVDLLRIMAEEVTCYPSRKPHTEATRLLDSERVSAGLVRYYCDGPVDGQTSTEQQRRLSHWSPARQAAMAAVSDYPEIAIGFEVQTGLSNDGLRAMADGSLSAVLSAYGQSLIATPSSVRQ